MNKGWFGLLGIVALVPGLLFFGALTITTGLVQQSIGGGACSSNGSTLTVDASKADGKTTFDQDQLSNAATIVNVGLQLNVPASGIQVALIVAIDESRLENLANPAVPASLSLTHQGTGTNGTSVGVFQQQNNWGSASNRLNVAWAAQAFFGGPTGPNHGSPAGLLDTAGWQSMSLPLAAQAVQVSFDGTGSNYARYQDTAQSLLTYLGTPTDGTSSDTANGASCAQQGATAIGSWTAPNGKTGADLVAFAKQFVGKVPYEMNCGAAGNPIIGWCCTGMVYYVYNTVLGIQLPGAYVSQQVQNLHQIPQSAAAAGDLVVWPNQHIGIYDGTGHVIAAADFGEGTKIDSLPFTIDGESPVYYRANTLGSSAP